MSSINDLKDFLTSEVKKTSYRKVAKDIGIQHRTVYNIVNGLSNNPTLQTVQKIVIAMNNQI